MRAKRALQGALAAALPFVFIVPPVAQIRERAAAAAWAERICAGLTARE